MRKATLGTLFLTVFLDLLGFGLVVPFLPGVARDLGASDLEAALLGAAYSLMQFVFIPVWGRMSDRVGRRPVLLVSIAASAAGMVILGFSSSVAGLLLARLFSGAATANIAVAQAYIADVTTPETRARGMGLIGIAFGLGFILGPFIGGELGRYEFMGRPGAIAAFAAAALSIINFAFAVFALPESLPPGARQAPSQRAWFDTAAFRATTRFPGVARAFAVGFSVIFWFAGLEQTFRLFTEDAFGMDVTGTGRVFAVVGVVAVVVQGGLIHHMTRRFGERRLITAATVCLAAGFLIIALAPSVGGFGRSLLFIGAGTVALGTGLHAPSISSYISRQAPADTQGMTLGVWQSLAALARVFGPAAGGLAYQLFGMRGPYALGAVGMLAALALAVGLPPLRARAEL